MEHPAIISPSLDQIRMSAVKCALFSYALCAGLILTLELD